MICKKDNPIFNHIFYILLQVLFIFIFLTIFFFTYVHSIEKKAFKTQIDTIVDDLSLDINVRAFVPKEYKDIANVIISNALDIEKNNAMKSILEDDKRIKERNNKIMRKAFLWVGILSGAMLVIALSIYLLGYCLPFHMHIKDSLITVFFIMITEIAFLLIITKEYLSIDLIEIRQTIGDTIQDYIKKRQQK